MSGHPYQPCWTAHFVEVVSGKLTSPEVCIRARDLCSLTGVKPVILRKEVHGFLGNRLQDALWREAMWIVNDGIASTEEVDQARSDGELVVEAVPPHMKRVTLLLVEVDVSRS